MKKLAIKLLVAAISSFLFFSCGTTENVTSSIEGKHMTVQQTNLGVKILLKKTAGEDINFIEIVDAENGSNATVDMKSKTDASLHWPFVEKGKEYTVTARLFGNSDYSEEQITFTVENDCISLLNYTDEYLNARLTLIADGDKRLVKIKSTSTDLMSVIANAGIEGASFNLGVYSGSKKAENKAVLAASFEENATDTTQVEALLNGYDIIANAKEFGITADEMNALLSKNSTYFAKANYKFQIKDEKDAVFGTKVIYSNDTIYTPVTAE